MVKARAFQNPLVYLYKCIVIIEKWIYLFFMCFLLISQDLNTLFFNSLKKPWRTSWWWWRIVTIQPILNSWLIDLPFIWSFCWALETFVFVKPHVNHSGNAFQNRSIYFCYICLLSCFFFFSISSFHNVLTVSDTIEAYFMFYSVSFYC